MIKYFALALTITAVAVSTSFANCGGGSCDKKDKGDKKPTKEEAARVLQF